MSVAGPRPIQRPHWSPLPFPGCRGVEAIALLRTDAVSLAMLRFGPNGTIHEHPADIDIDVVCLEGRGSTSVDGETFPIATGEMIRWPAGRSHRLWTEHSPMTTLMVEWAKTPPAR